MQLIVIATLALVAAVAAAPADSNLREVKIVRSEYEQQPEGSYVFNYETDDGSKREEAGELKTVNDEENKPVPVVTVRGSYSYVDLEGKPHSYTYYADEEGFHIEGEDIPKVQQ